MKIQQNPGITQERFFSVRERGKDTPSFQEVLDVKQSQLSQERFHALISKMEEQGNRLSTSKSLKDLMEYKQTIRELMKEVASNSYSLEERRGFHPNGREKRLMLIKQVDKHLVELSEQVLEKQASSVDLLRKMDEIKGLLINLYL